MRRRRKSSNFRFLSNPIRHKKAKSFCCLFFAQKASLPPPTPSASSNSFSDFPFDFRYARCERKKNCLARADCEWFLCPSLSHRPPSLHSTRRRMERRETTCEWVSKANGKIEFIWASMCLSRALKSRSGNFMTHSACFNRVLIYLIFMNSICFREAECGMRNKTKKAEVNWFSLGATFHVVVWRVRKASKRRSEKGK